MKGLATKYLSHPPKLRGFIRGGRGNRTWIFFCSSVTFLEALRLQLSINFQNFRIPKFDRINMAAPPLLISPYMDPVLDQNPKEFELAQV